MGMRAVSLTAEGIIRALFAVLARVLEGSMWRAAWALNVSSV